MRNGFNRGRKKNSTLMPGSFILKMERKNNASNKTIMLSNTIGKK
jgi:hypothetical protein